MNITEIRKQIILNLIELHNHFVKTWHKEHPTLPLNLWNKDEYEMKPDRYYIVETLTVDNQDYDNKTFKPQMQVRKHLRSQERKAMGNKCSAFFDGYLSTIPFDIEYVMDVEAGKSMLNKELNKSGN